MSVLLGDLEPAVEAIFSTRHERIVAAEIVFLLTKGDQNTYPGRGGGGGGGKRNGAQQRRGGGSGVLPLGRSAARGVASSVLLSAEQRVPMLFVLSTPLDVASATHPGSLRGYRDPVTDGGSGVHQEECGGGGGRGGGTGGSSLPSSTADGASTSPSAPPGQGGSGAANAGGEGVSSNRMLQLRLDRRGMLVTFDMRGHAHLKLRHCFSLQRLRGTSTESASSERGRHPTGPGREGGGNKEEAGRDGGRSDGGGLHSSFSFPGREACRQGDPFSASHALVPHRRAGGAEEGVELTLDFGTGGTFTVQFESHIQREMMLAAIHRLQGYSHLLSSSSSSTRPSTTIHHRFPSSSSSSTSFPSLVSGVAWNGADHRRGDTGWAGVEMSHSSMRREEGEGHSESARGIAGGEKMRIGGRRDMVFTPEEEGIVMAYCSKDAVQGAAGSGGGGVGGGESGKGFDDTPHIEQALLHDQKVMELELVQTLVQSSSLFSVAKGQVRRLMRDVELLEQRISLHSAHLLTKRQVIQHIERENNMLQRRKRNLEVLQESVLELQRILQLPPEMEECLKKLQNLGGGTDDEAALAAFFKEDRNVQNLSKGMCQMQAVIQDPELPVRFPIPALAERRGYFLNLRRLIVFRSKEYLFTLIDEYESAFFQAMKEQKKKRKKQKHPQKQQQHGKGEKERKKGDDTGAGRSSPASASFPFASTAEPEESPRVWVVWSEHDGLHRKLLQMNAIIQALGRIDMEGFMALLRRYRLAMSRMYGAEMKMLFTSLLSQLRTCTKKKKTSSSSSLKSLFSLSKPPRFLLGSSHASFPYLAGFRAETLAAGDVLAARGTLPLPCEKEIILQIPPRYRPSSLTGDGMEGPSTASPSFSMWTGGGGGVGSPSIPSLRPAPPLEGSGGGGGAAPSPRGSVASTAVPPTGETARLAIPFVPMKDRLGMACPALIGAACLTRALSPPSPDPHGETSLCGSPSWTGHRRLSSGGEMGQRCGVGGVPPPVPEGGGLWAFPSWWYTAGLQVFQDGQLFSDPLTLAGVRAHRVGGMRGLHVGMDTPRTRLPIGKGVLGCGGEDRGGGGWWSCGSGGESTTDATAADRRGTGRQEEGKGMASGRLPRRLHGGGGALRPDLAVGWLLECVLSSILVEELVLSECFGVAEGWTWPAAEEEEEGGEEEDDEEGEEAWGSKGFGGEEPSQGRATGSGRRRERRTLLATTTTSSSSSANPHGTKPHASRRSGGGGGVDTSVASHLPFPPPHHQYYHSTLPRWLASCTRGRGPPLLVSFSSFGVQGGGDARPYPPQAHEMEDRHEVERSVLDAPVGTAYARGYASSSSSSLLPTGVANAFTFFSPFTLMAMEGLRGGGGMTKARRAYEQHHAQLLHECLAEMFFGEANGALHYVLKRIGARVLSFGQTVAKTPADAVRRAQRRRRRDRNGLGAVPASSSSFSFHGERAEAAEEEEEEEEEEWEEVGEGEDACKVVVPLTNSKGFGRMQRILRHHFLVQMVSGFTRFVGTHCDKMYAVPILSMVQSLQKPLTPPSLPTLLPSSSPPLPPPRPPLTQSTFCMVLLREVETVMAGAMMEHIQEQVASIEKGKRQHYLRPTPLFCGWEKFPLYVYRMEALMNGLYVPTPLRSTATATSISITTTAASSPVGRREEERSGSLFQGYLDKSGFSAPTFGSTSGPLSARGNRGGGGGDRPPLRIWVEEEEREAHDGTEEAVRAAKEREEEEEEEEASADFYSQYTSILHRFLDQLFLAVDDITGVSVPTMGMTWSAGEVVSAFLPSSAEGASFPPAGTLEAKGATRFSSPTGSSSRLWSEEEEVESGGEASTSASPPSPSCGGGPSKKKTTKGAFADTKKSVKKEPSSGSKGKFHFPFFSSSSSKKTNPHPPRDPRRQEVGGAFSSGATSLPPPPPPSSSYTAGETHFFSSPIPPPHLAAPASGSPSHPKGYAILQALNYVHHGASHSGRESGSWWSSWGRWKDRMTRPGRRRREAAASARLRSALLGSSSSAPSALSSGVTLGSFTEGKPNGAVAAHPPRTRGGGGEMPSTREGLVAASALFGSFGGGGRGGEGGVSSEVKWRSIHQYRHHAYFCTFYSTLSPLSPTRKCLRRWFDISRSKRDHYERIYLERVLLLQELPIFGTFTTAVQELLEVYSENELRHHRAVSVEVVRGTVAAMEAEIPKGVPQCAERMRQHFLRDVPLESPSLQFHKTLLQRTWQHFCRLVEARFAFMENLLKLEVYVAQGIVLRMTKSELVLNVLNKV